jgi:hypothetical protein
LSVTLKQVKSLKNIALFILISYKKLTFPAVYNLPYIPYLGFLHSI